MKSQKYSRLTCAFTAHVPVSLRYALARTFSHRLHLRLFGCVSCFITVALT